MPVSLHEVIKANEHLSSNKYATGPIEWSVYTLYIVSRVVIKRCYRVACISTVRCVFRLDRRRLQLLWGSLLFCVFFVYLWSSGDGVSSLARSDARYFSGAPRRDTSPVDIYAVSGVYIKVVKHILYCLTALIYTPLTAYMSTGDVPPQTHPRGAPEKYLASDLARLETPPPLDHR
jgi:hypothetical protein